VITVTLYSKHLIRVNVTAGMLMYLGSLASCVCTCYLPEPVESFACRQSQEIKVGRIQMYWWSAIATEWVWLTSNLIAIIRTCTKMWQMLLVQCCFDFINSRASVSLNWARYSLAYTTINSYFKNMSTYLTMQRETCDLFIRYTIAIWST
jgi:hypothetical protein